MLSGEVAIRPRRFRVYPAAGLVRMISQKAKYAFHALVALARTRLADGRRDRRPGGIPRKFLEQILLELKRHGIVQSRRGKFGGYGLLMPADRITFGQVLRILDGPIAPLPCLSRIAYRRCSDCQTEENCEIRRVFAKVAEFGERRSRPHHHRRCHQQQWRLPEWRG